MGHSSYLELMFLNSVAAVEFFHTPLYLCNVLTAGATTKHIIMQTEQIYDMHLNEIYNVIAAFSHIIVRAHARVHSAQSLMADSHSTPSVSLSD